MNGAQELGTAIANKIDITIIVLNDNCYGMIKWKCALSSLATGNVVVLLPCSQNLAPPPPNGRQRDWA